MAASPVPAKRPCPSCPYRRDVPSGVWDREEYEKLPLYDLPTAEQPFSAFYCHQQDGRFCAGWVGCHEMPENIGIRLADLTREEFDAVVGYETDVPLFESGAEAAAHGLRDLEFPSEEARLMVDRLRRKLGGDRS